MHILNRHKMIFFVHNVVFLFKSLFWYFGHTKSRIPLGRARGGGQASLTATPPPKCSPKILNFSRFVRQK